MSDRGRQKDRLTVAILAVATAIGIALQIGAIWKSFRALLGS